MIQKLLFATAIFSFALTISCQAHAWTPKCLTVEEDEIDGNEKTLNQLIVDSKYIGLYKVDSVELTAEKSDDGYSSKVYKAKLTLSYGLTYRPPNKIEVYSSSPAIEPPPEFYFLKERHQDMVENMKLSMGQTYGIVLSGGQCEYGTNFIKGYEYLVFGGSKSKAAIEPILSVKYDPFYREIKRLLNKKKEKARD